MVEPVSAVLITKSNSLAGWSIKNQSTNQSINIKYPLAFKLRPKCKQALFVCFASLVKLIRIYWKCDGSNCIITVSSPFLKHIHIPLKSSDRAEHLYKSASFTWFFQRW